MSIYYKSRTSVINGIIHLKSWSSFKLFYAFRPTAIFQFLTTCLAHQLEGHGSKSKQLTKLNYILSELLKSSNDDIMNRSKIMTVSNSLQQHIKTLNEQRLKEKKSLDIRWTGYNTAYSVRLVASWLFLALLSTFLLCVGIMSLLLKISQLSFINNTDIFSLSLHEYYFLLAFCNQLWNMAN
eukprot:168387_1